MNNYNSLLDNFKFKGLKFMGMLQIKANRDQQQKKGAIAKKEQ